MNIFRNKFLVKLITVITLTLIVFMFGMNSFVYAEESDDKEVEGWGGVLVKPIIKLLTGIGDGIMDVLEKNINGNEPAFTRLKGPESWWQKWGAIIITVIVVAVIAVLVAVGGIAVAGTIAAAGVALGTKVAIVATAAAVGAGAGFFIGDMSDGAHYADTIYLPYFTVSVDKIFSDKVALLDINFFRDESDKTYTKKVRKNNERKLTSWKNDDSTESGFVITGRYYNLKDCIRTKIEKGAIEDSQYNYIESIINDINNSLNNDEKINLEEDYYITVSSEENNTTWGEDVLGYTRRMTIKHIKINDSRGNTFEITYTYCKTGEQYFEWKQEETVDISRTTISIVDEPIESTAMQLKSVISTWYYILRNIALLVLMLILIYIGIKIVISSTAGEKAKYKERLTDWLVALCLVMVMHYIMIFAVQLGEKITDLVTAISGDRGIHKVIILTQVQKDWINKNEEELSELVDAEGRLVWSTNLMGAMKIDSQLEKEGTFKWVGLGIAYMVLVLFTVFFIWTYLKRVVYMAFLTMVAPLVAMTYPIDKMNDGKAQAFDTWLKEYIFNLLIQPMHLLLYTILISSAYMLAAQNVIYTLVAIGFMIPAEKLLRRFFGFEKAQTPGLLGGAAGAALTMTGLQQLMRHRPKDRKREDNEKDDSIKTNISQAGSNPYDTLLGGKSGASYMSEAPEKTEKSDNEPKQEQPAEEDNTNIHMAATPANTNNADNNKTAEQTQQYQGILTSANMQMPANAQAKQQNKQKEKAKTKLGRTIKGVSGAYFRGMGNKALKRIKKGRPIRALARGAAGLTTGALLGTTGIALGIASGDPNKVAQYAGLGVAGGYGLGKGVAGAAVDTLSVNAKDIDNELDHSWYGEEYMSKKLEQDRKQKLMTEENIETYRTLTGKSRKDSKDFLDTKGTIYFNNGIRDVEDMETIERALQNGDIPDMQTAIAAMKLKKNLPSELRKMTADKQRQYQETYKQVYMDKLKQMNKGRNVNPEQMERVAQSKAEDTVRYIKDLESINSSLYEA